MLPRKAGGTQRYWAVLKAARRLIYHDYYFKGILSYISAGQDSDAVLLFRVWMHLLHVALKKIRQLNVNVFQSLSFFKRIMKNAFLEYYQGIAG